MIKNIKLWDWLTNVRVNCLIFKIFKKKNNLLWKEKL